MTQRKITVTDVMSTKPCYSHEQVAELFGDLEYVTMEQILACDIPIADRVWVGVYLLTDLDHVVEFAKKCAKRAKEYADSVDSTAATNAAAAADSADYAAAYAAHIAAAATYGYARGAAARGARDSAAAADSAHYVFYAAYADSVDSTAEYNMQIDHLLELHKKEEKA